jgi:hypothetical protein
MGKSIYWHSKLFRQFPPLDVAFVKLTYTQNNKLFDSVAFGPFLQHGMHQLAWRARWSFQVANIFFLIITSNTNLLKF